MLFPNFFFLIVLIFSKFNQLYGLFTPSLLKINRHIGTRRLNMSIESKKFCLNVTLYVKPEKREEFIKVIKGNQQGTLTTEPQAKLYTWGESTTQSNVFYFQEQYSSKEGFEYHTKTDHFKIWELFAGADVTPFIQPPEVSFFQEM